ncbi:helix-turn-helix transcriptional regulator [Asticcacaulis sp.]|uniref:AraC family transcriptional regulator n=1 Tax=Asticcacaulis sp. TaxID=1872648 RepID=UPI003F7BB296
MQEPENIVSGTYQRRIVSRPGVGATATVRQVSEVRIARLLVQQPSLIVVKRGTKVVSQGDLDITAVAGDAVFLRGGRFDVVNKPDGEGLYEAFWLAWTSDSLAKYRATLACPPRDIVSRLSDISAPMAETLSRAHSAVRDPDLPDTIALHRIEEVLPWLLHCGVDIAPSDDRGLANRVTALISANPGFGWSLKHLARHLSVSEATLRRHLATGGTRFSELLIDARMSAALSLLQSTDRPVEHIAMDVGYNSPSRFAVRFRARFGFAPTAIRGHNRPIRPLAI